MNETLEQMIARRDHELDKVKRLEQEWADREEEDGE